MTSQGLAQIDENSSLVQSQSNVAPRLPTLLTRNALQPDLLGEKTPESWPRRSPCGDATPEVWPKTPTPTAGMYRRGVFPLFEQTPEVWHDSAPSFCMEAQPQANYQGLSMMIPTPGMGTFTPFVPMWQAPAPCPAGMAFDGTMFNFLNMTQSASANVGTPMLDTAVAPAVNSSAEIVAQCQGAVDGSSAKRAPNGKRPSKTANDEGESSDDGCPIAVFVDLSSLKERVPARRQFGGQR